MGPALRHADAASVLNVIASQTGWCYNLPGVLPEFHVATAQESSAEEFGPWKRNKTVGSSIVRQLLAQTNTMQPPSCGASAKGNHSSVVFIWNPSILGPICIIIYFILFPN